MKTNDTIFDKGAEWVKVDLHLHTYNNEKNSVENSENTNFAAEFVSKLKEKNIRIGAISSNNKFDTDEFVEMWQAAWEQDIYLLPAVELTIKEGLRGTHIIVVFEEQWIDNDSDTNYINAFMDTLPEDLDDPSVLRQHGLDLEATVKQLNSYGYDYFIILAHIDLENGLCAEMDSMRLKKFVNTNAFKQRVLGLEVSTADNECTQIEKYLKNSLPIVVNDKYTEANKIDREAGTQMYLKIGDWGYRAVKNALIHHTSQLSPEVHQHKTQYITSVQFDSGLASGETIQFNSEMNCITGRRGSGKSAIIESIRYVLGKRPFGNTKYKDNLPMLLAGDKIKIAVELNINNDIIRIERDSSGKAKYYVNGKETNTLDNYLKADRILYFGEGELTNIKSEYAEELFYWLISDVMNDINGEIDARNKEVRTMAENIFADNSKDDLINLSDFDEKEINTLLNSIAKMQILWQDEFEVVKNQTRKINAFSLPIRTQAIAQENKEAYQVFMASIFNPDIIAESQLNTIIKAYRNPVLIFEDIIHHDGEIFKILDDETLKKFKKRFYKNISKLITYRPLDTIKIRYNRRLFGEISQSERASAILLLLLLFDSTDILIIDHPEQALDNYAIYNELIPRLIEAKDKMQFIFATQSPNIVVSSFCEQLIVSKKDEESLSYYSGSTDKEEIQKELLDIMEGGTEAFKHRSDIYKSWIQ